MANGDIILQIGNVELCRIEDLVSEIQKRKIGESTKIFALRNGRKRICELTFNEAP